jgi:hypothetical protein
VADAGGLAGGGGLTIELMEPAMEGAAAGGGGAPPRFVFFDCDDCCYQNDW